MQLLLEYILFGYFLNLSEEIKIGCISNFRSCPNLKLPFAAAFSTFVLIQKWSKKSRLHKKT
jgi:hypothetical protein